MSFEKICNILQISDYEKDICAHPFLKRKQKVKGLVEKIYRPGDCAGHFGQEHFYYKRVPLPEMLSSICGYI